MHPASFLYRTLMILLSCTTFKVVADQPDNSRVNQRDSSQAERTAEDQGNSKEDIALTQKIRRQIVQDSTLSINAKNIKIISLNGTVTLKGPVHSTNEKREIENIANKVAGASNVTSQIEVMTQ